MVCADNYRTGNLRSVNGKQASNSKPKKEEKDFWEDG